MVRGVPLTVRASITEGKMKRIALAAFFLGLFGWMGAKLVGSRPQQRVPDRRQP
jgi:hypothetical protein